MPMSGSNYVAPTWVNNAPPALDAAELQAMCNTIVQNQGDAAALRAAISSLTSVVNGATKVLTGSYIGTGVHGSNNPNTLSFSENVFAFFIAGNQSGDGIGAAYFVYPGDGGYVTGELIDTKWNSQRNVSWYNGHYDSAQMNSSGVTYTWYALYL